MNPRESRPAIVRIKGCLVYAGTMLCPLNAAFPQGVHRVTSLDGHSVAMTCAQMAIIPRNSANDANAAASSTTTLNMIPLRPRTERELSLWSVLCQGAPNPLIGPSLQPITCDIKYTYFFCNFTCFLPR